MSRRSRELVKIVCVAVTIERNEQGVIEGEAEGSPVACYSGQALGAFWGAVQAEVEAFNASQPNRAQRRGRTKTREATG